MERIKNWITFVILGISLIIALFITPPNELYRSFKAEDEILNLDIPFITEAKEKGEKVVINYLGGNVYSIKIDRNDYLIRKVKKSNNANSYVFFYTPDSLDYSRQVNKDALSMEN